MVIKSEYKLFILNNYKKMTVSEMCKHLKLTYNQVYDFCSRMKIKPLCKYNNFEGELTEREAEVLKYLLLDTKTIAERLYLSPSTIKCHIVNIRGKFGVITKEQALFCALKRGFVKIDEIIEN